MTLKGQDCSNLNQNVEFRRICNYALFENYTDLNINLQLDTNIKGFDSQ